LNTADKNFEEKNKKGIIALFLPYFRFGMFSYVFVSLKFISHEVINHSPSAFDAVFVIYSMFVQTVHPLQGKYIVAVMV